MLKLTLGTVFVGVAVWNFVLRPRSGVGPTYLDDSELRLDTMLFTITSHHYKLIKLQVDLAVNIGPFIPEGDGLQRCNKPEFDLKTHCVEFDRVTRFEIEHKKRSGDKCYVITWISLSHDFIPQDCIHLDEDVHWFGGPSLHGEQAWPINQKRVIKMAPYLSGDAEEDAGAFGAASERYWLSSKGVGVYVPNDVPLHVSWNEHGSRRFCLKADFKGAPYMNHKGSPPVLKYVICDERDVRRVHFHMFRRSFQPPNKLSSEEAYARPIWYFTGRNGDKDITTYAKGIRKSGLPLGQININENLSPLEGAHALAISPNFSNVINTLHKFGFLVSSDISPFLSMNGTYFEIAKQNNYLLMDGSNKVPALFKHRGELRTLIDLTNPSATHWYVESVKQFQENSGLDTFSFGSVRPVSFPHMFHSYRDIMNPDDYTQAYVDMMTGFGDSVQSNVGHLTQRHSVLLQGLSTAPRWGYDGGLKAVIPHMLRMGLLGYHGALPGVIGGRRPTQQASKELFIRWTQLAAYMPIMQFSTPPWNYDEETVRICREFTRIHEKRVAPLLSAAGSDVMDKGAPVVRPLWWRSPHDPLSLKCHDQYYLGDSLLVAPVLHDGARSRDVYLPAGHWRDELRGGGEELAGRQWLRDYRVDLHEIATFQLVRDVRR